MVVHNGLLLLLTQPTEAAGQTLVHQLVHQPATHGDEQRGT
jgi:hypothetical protein